MNRTVPLAGMAMLAWAGPSQATVMAAASLYGAPYTASTVTTVDLSGVSAPSNATLAGAGYVVTFATAGGQGVVRGTVGGAYAVPVAGMANGIPTYLTGGYGSGRTGSADQAGNYFSTGVGSITVSFAAVQRSLALLWGSIDGYNSISFLDAAGNTLDTLYGSDVQALAAGFASPGFQGAGGSAFVTATESLGFSAVRFDSSVPSFEFAGLAASTGVFAVPEPLSLALFGAGLAGVAVVRRRRGSSPA